MAVVKNGLVTSRTRGAALFKPKLLKEVGGVEPAGKAGTVK